MELLVETAYEVAVKAAREAGALIREKFYEPVMSQQKDQYGDIVTEIDYMSEEIIIQLISEAFPTHAISSEEAGGNEVISDWQWIIDPLDGTNNFAVKMPVFAVSIALLHQSIPVLGIVYEPMVNRLYTAICNQGAFENNFLLSAQKNMTGKRFTLGWVQGHHVQNYEKAVKLRQAIDHHCKRLMRLRAPSIQWVMLAGGYVDAIILYEPEKDDLYAGLLIAKEAGYITIDFHGQPVEIVDSLSCFIACHPKNIGVITQLVQETGK